MTPSREISKSSRVMKSWLSRPPSRFNIKSSHKTKPKWLPGLLSSGGCLDSKLLVKGRWVNTTKRPLPRVLKLRRPTIMPLEGTLEALMGLYRPIWKAMHFILWSSLNWHEWHRIDVRWAAHEAPEDTTLRKWSTYLFGELRRYDMLWNIALYVCQFTRHGLHRISVCDHYTVVHQLFTENNTAPRGRRGPRLYTVINCGMTACGGGAPRIWLENERTE